MLINGLYLEFISGNLEKNPFSFYYQVDSPGIGVCFLFEVHFGWNELYIVWSNYELNGFCPFSDSESYIKSTGCSTTTLFYFLLGSWRESRLRDATYSCWIVFKESSPCSFLLDMVSLKDLIDLRF